MSLTVSQGHQEPDHSEQEPRKEKRGGETENGPVPGSSNHWREEIFQVSGINILLKYISEKK